MGWWQMQTGCSHLQHGAGAGLGWSWSLPVWVIGSSPSGCLLACGLVAGARGVLGGGCGSRAPGSWALGGVVGDGDGQLLLELVDLVGGEAAVATQGLGVAEPSFLGPAAHGLGRDRQPLGDLAGGQVGLVAHRFTSLRVLVVGGQERAGARPRSGYAAEGGLAVTAWWALCPAVWACWVAS